MGSGIHTLISPRRYGKQTTLVRKGTLRRWRSDKKIYLKQIGAVLKPRVMSPVIPMKKMKGLRKAMKGLVTTMTNQIGKAMMTMIWRMMTIIIVMPTMSVKSQTISPTTILNSS